MTTPYAFVARLEAKPERSADVAALLAGALALAQAEPGTVAWYPARTSPTPRGRAFSPRIRSRG
jgi:quinol monooxygenase YgiN